MVTRLVTLSRKWKFYWASDYVSTFSQATNHPTLAKKQAGTPAEHCSHTICGHVGTPVLMSWELCLRWWWGWRGFRDKPERKQVTSNQHCCLRATFGPPSRCIASAVAAVNFVMASKWSWRRRGGSLNKVYFYCYVFWYFNKSPP